MNNNCVCVRDSGSIKLLSHTTYIQLINHTIAVVQSPTCSHHTFQNTASKLQQQNIILYVQSIETLLTAFISLSESASLQRSSVTFFTHNKEREQLSIINLVHRRKKKNTFYLFSTGNFHPNHDFTMTVTQTQLVQYHFLRINL